MNTKATLAMLGVSLSFGIMATTEAVANSVQMGESNAKPVVVDSVFCDNEYGTAMEAAILEAEFEKAQKQSRITTAMDNCSGERLDDTIEAERAEAAVYSRVPDYKIEPVVEVSHECS